MARSKYTWVQLQGWLGSGETVSRSFTRSKGGTEFELEISFCRNDLLQMRIALHSSNPPTSKTSPPLTPTYLLQIREYDWDSFNADDDDPIILQNEFDTLQDLLHFLETKGYLSIKEIIKDPENIPLKNKITTPSVNPSKKITPPRNTTPPKPNIQRPRAVKS